MPKDKNETLERVENLINTVDEQVTKPMFLKAFENVVNLIMKVKEDVFRAIGRLEELHNISSSKLEKDSTQTLTDLKKQTNELFVKGRLDEMDNNQQSSFSGLKAELNELIDAKLVEVDDRISKVKDGEKGKRGEIGRTGLTRIVESL